MNKKPVTVLVIEDNPNLLEAVLTVLDFSGYSATGIARTGDIDFQRLYSHPPDLILLDVMLSGADGRDLARTFKSEESTRQVPIVMMSAYPNVEESALQAGADDFLPKPFGLDDLAEKVRHNLDLQT